MAGAQVRQRTADNRRWAGIIDRTVSPTGLGNGPSTIGEPFEWNTGVQGLGFDETILTPMSLSAHNAALLADDSTLDQSSSPVVVDFDPRNTGSRLRFGVRATVRGVFYRAAVPSNTAGVQPYVLVETPDRSDTIRLIDCTIDGRGVPGIDSMFPGAPTAGGAYRACLGVGAISLLRCKLRGTSDIGIVAAPTIDQSMLYGLVRTYDQTLSGPSQGVTLRWPSGSAPTITRSKLLGYYRGGDTDGVRAYAAILMGGLTDSLMSGMLVQGCWIGGGTAHLVERVGLPVSAVAFLDNTIDRTAASPYDPVNHPADYASRWRNNRYVDTHAVAGGY